MAPHEEDYGDDTISQEELEGYLAQARQANNTRQNTARTLNSFAEDKRDSNFLHLQISTEEMLNKLEHFYRGDVRTYVDGEVYWEPQDNKDLVTFNEFGVTSMMEIVTKYIDRNTILSDYTEQRIYEIIGDIGDEIINLLLWNYKQLGMDTYFKKTKFRIIVTTTVHIIESAYRRAKGAKTLEKLNESKVIGQFGDHSSPGQVPMRRRGVIDRLLGRP